jgi:small subunit ribosomal protein S14
MAKLSLMVKASRTPKYSSRAQRRCQICGRIRGVYRKFQICRVCFRTLSSKGEIPGVRKASW